MVCRDDFIALPLDTPDWRAAGMGGFRAVSPGVVESDGGPGVYWYTAGRFDDFDLMVEWQASAKEDNSGVFLRFPPLSDWRAAAECGFEVQIDDRGLNPATGRFHDPSHQTGAVYGLAPARLVTSLDLGEWNVFEIAVRGPAVLVVLNGTAVARLERDVGRPRSGHLGLQSHDPQSRVRFRNLCIRPA